MSPEDRAERERVVRDMLDEAAKRRAAIAERLAELDLAEMFPPTDDEDDQ